MENNEELQKQTQEKIDDLLIKERKNPKDAEIKIELGILYNMLGKYDDAIDWYKKSLEIKPDSLKAIGNICFVYRNLGKYDDAIEWYKKALLINHGLYEVMNTIGVLYDNLGDYDKAIKWYKNALEIKSDYIVPMNNLGVLYGKLYEYKEAIEWYKNALNINLDNYEIMNNLGVLYEKLDEYKEAIEWYKKTLNINLDNYEIMNHLGVLYGKLNDHKIAMEWFKKALKINPDNYEIMNNIGISYNMLGKYKEALEWLKKALITKPYNNMSLNIIYFLYFELGEYEESIKWSKKVWKNDNKLWNAISIIGHSYLIENKTRHAMRYYNLVLRKDPNNINAILGIGICYYKLDEYSKAIECFNNLIFLSPNYYKNIDDLYYLSINNLINLYIDGENKTELISLYDKCIKEKDESRFHVFKFMIACFLRKNNNNHELLNLLKDSMPENYKSGVISIIEIFTNSIYSDYLDKFNDIIVSEDCIDYKEHMIVKIIFEETNDFDEAKKVLIRQLLIKLYKQIIDIKEILRLKEKEKNKKNIEICHYARLGSIKNIIKKDKDNYIVDFRFSNIAYMNDPQEGKKFFELIKNNKKKDMDLVDEKESNKVVYKSNTYLGCFSKNIDGLPLWVQYTNNGEGCCLVINKNTFDDIGDYCFSQIESDIIKNNSDKKENKDVSIDKQISGNDTLDNKIKNETQRYVLYNVAYVDKDKNISFDEKDEKSEESKNINNLLDNIQDLIGEINNIEIKDEDNKKDIEVVVNDILDQVRFLFKDKDYEHEQELRIIKFSREPEVDYVCGDVPKLYLKFDKNIKIEKVVLGPRIGEAKDIAQYLYHSGKVKEVLGSTIEYR